MAALKLQELSTVLTVFLLITMTVLAQTPGRNLSFPSPTTSAVPSVGTGIVSVNNNNSNPTNGTGSPQTSAGNNTNSNNNSTNHGSNNTSTPVKLTPIPDSTGTGASVPVPGAAGGKANGRYGPDDQYIAAATNMAISLPSTCLTVMSTIFIISYPYIV